MERALAGAKPRTEHRSSLAHDGILEEPRAQLSLRRGLSSRRGARDRDSERTWNPRAPDACGREVRNAIGGLRRRGARDAFPPAWPDREADRRRRARGPRPWIGGCARSRSRGDRPPRPDRDSGRSAAVDGASTAGQVPEDRLRRLVDDRVEIAKAEKEDGHEHEWAVSLEGPPGVGLARRQQRVDDTRAIQRRNRK